MFSLTSAQILHLCLININQIRDVSDFVWDDTMGAGGACCYHVRNRIQKPTTGVILYSENWQPDSEKLGWGTLLDCIQRSSLEV